MSRPRLQPPPELYEDIGLCVLVAPAGYGKTTAAVQLAQTLDPGYRWLSIETAENDPSRFVRYVSAALALPAESIEFVADVPATAQGLQLATDVLRSHLDKLEAPVVLVLDDLDRIENPAILEMIASWILVPSPNLTLICATRCDLQLPLDKLRTHRRLHELTSEDLAFTASEVQALFDSLEVAPETATVDSTMDNTEGWPALVALTALGGYADLGGPNPHLDHFLEFEALSQVPPNQLEFLRTTSVATVLTPALCHDLVRVDAAETHDPSTTLSRLMGCGLLRSVAPLARRDSKTAPDLPAFQLHPLLRACLSRMLETQSPDRFRKLNHTAANWYHAQGHLDEAINCATRGHDVELGQRLVGSSWQIALRSAELGAAQEWARTVGPDGTAHGLVCLILAWGALNDHNETEMRHWLRRAATFSRNRPTEPYVSATHHLFMARWANKTGQIAIAANHANAAVELLGPLREGAFDRPVREALLGSSACADGIVGVLRGDHDEARETLTAAVAFSRKPDHERNLVLGLGYLALLDAWSGNSANALDLADEAIARLEIDPQDGSLQHVPHLARSIAHLSSGDDEAAMREVTAALETIGTEFEPIQRGLIYLQQARVQHFRGRLADARASLQQARESARTCSPSILQRQIRSVENELRFVGLGSNRHLPPDARSLTERELEIVRELPGPLSRGEIATRLHISENTVKTHLTAISRKLDASGRSDIVERATELGLIDAGKNR